MIEQNQRSIKRVTKQTTGFKSFEVAEATFSGIELHHMLKKGQHVASGHMGTMQLGNNFMHSLSNCILRKTN